MFNRYLWALCALLVLNKCVFGIRYFYLDIGTNDGTSIKSFVQGIHGEVATDGSSSLDGGWSNLLKGCNCQKDGVLWNIVAVEANPRFATEIEAVKNELLSNNSIRSMSMYTGVAISTRNGFIDLILDGKDEDAVGQAGSSTMNDSFSAVGRHVKIQAMDIITLFKRERITQHDFVVVKLDIEGAEYDIVRRILLYNLWQYIDRLAVEWHHEAFFVFGMPNDPSAPDYQQRVDNHLKYSKQYESLKWMVEGLTNNWKIHNWG